jgi:hypothetical protein
LVTRHLTVYGSELSRMPCGEPLQVNERVNIYMPRVALGVSRVQSAKEPLNQVWIPDTEKLEIAPLFLEAGGRFHSGSLKADDYTNSQK